MVKMRLEKIGAWFRKNPLMICVCYLLFYAVAFHWLEVNIEPKYIVFCELDRFIPFCEEFIIPYIFWFPYIAGIFIWFSRRGWEDFKKLCLMVFSGLTICLLIYYLFPTGLTLRLMEGPHETGALYNMVVMLRAIDTPTNVCPSIHVMNTVMVFQAICGLRDLKHRKLTIAVNFVLMILICASTVFLDQHSIIDVICGVLMSLVIHEAVYGGEWRMEQARQKHRGSVRRVS